MSRLMGFYLQKWQGNFLFFTSLFLGRKGLRTSRNCMKRICTNNEGEGNKVIRLWSCMYFGSSMDYQVLLMYYKLYQRWGLKVWRQRRIHGWKIKTSHVKVMSTCACLRTHTNLLSHAKSHTCKSQLYCIRNTTAVIKTLLRKKREPEIYTIHTF